MFIRYKVPELLGKLINEALDELIKAYYEK